MPQESSPKKKMLSTAGKLAVEAVEVAVNIGRRTARRVKSAMEELDLAGNLFYFTVRRDLVYWRKGLSGGWVGVNEPDMRLNDTLDVRYVPIRVNMTGGVPHFNNEMLTRVRVLFTDFAYAKYVADQETLELFGEPEVFKLIVESPSGKVLRSLKTALAKASAAREEKRRQCEEAKQKVKDLFKRE